MSYSMSEMEVSLNRQIIFGLLLNIKQRNYVLSRTKEDASNFLNGIGNCGDVADYFDKFYLDHELKAWV